MTAFDTVSALLRRDSPHFPGQRDMQAVSHPPAWCPGPYRARSGNARLPVPASVSRGGREHCPAMLVALGGGTQGNKPGLGLPSIPAPPF